MTVSVRKGQLDYFRKKCKANPTEIMAMLLGFRHSADYAEVVQFVYPDLEISTRSETLVSGDEVDRVDELAELLGLEVLGSAHSHPDYLPILSPTDHRLFKDFGDLIVGVCEVPKTGRTRVVFWTRNTSLPCDLVYEKEKKKK